MNSRIWYPIPVHDMDKNIAMDEHHAILSLAHTLYEVSTAQTPEHHDSYNDPEVRRWLPHMTGLHDRYQRSREFLGKEIGMEVINIWTHPLFSGSRVMYPQDSERFVLDMWAEYLDATSMIREM